jgi:adenylylsulfate kinase
MEHQGFTIWFTGLPCAGKTSISVELEQKLSAAGYKVERLDGDNLRQHLTKDLGFTPEDRTTNIERVAYVAKLLSRNGVITLCAFIAPSESQRNHARETIDNYIEAFVDTPLEVCKQRDVKGMYQKAEKGEIENFTGVSAPYEEPENPEIKLDTVANSAEESAEQVLEYLRSNGWIESNGDALTDEEQGMMEQRLKDLGYM